MAVIEIDRILKKIALDVLHAADLAIGVLDGDGHISHHRRRCRAGIIGRHRRGL